jgi:hypothetical protein
MHVEKPQEELHLIHVLFVFDYQPEWPPTLSFRISKREKGWWMIFTLDVCAFVLFIFEKKKTWKEGQYFTGDNFLYHNDARNNVCDEGEKNWWVEKCCRLKI